MPAGLDGSGRSTCAPPWLLLSGLATAPSVLLTWYWRTISKNADLDQKNCELQHHADVLKHQYRLFDTARADMSSVTEAGTKARRDRFADTLLRLEEMFSSRPLVEARTLLDRLPNRGQLMDSPVPVLREDQMLTSAELAPDKLRLPTAALAPTYCAAAQPAPVPDSPNHRRPPRSSSPA
jgi:hypothetical protein